MVIVNEERLGRVVIAILNLAVKRLPGFIDATPEMSETLLPMTKF